MKSSLRVAVASYPSLVTVALTGTLSRAGAMRAMRACERVPFGVRVVHLDLRRVRLFEVSALEFLLSTLRRHRQVESGVVIVTRPFDCCAP